MVEDSDSANSATAACRESRSRSRRSPSEAATTGTEAEHRQAFVAVAVELVELVELAADHQENYHHQTDADFGPASSPSLNNLAPPSPEAAAVGKRLPESPVEVESPTSLFFRR